MWRLRSANTGLLARQLLAGHPSPLARPSTLARALSAEPSAAAVDRLRNIGISAHIDSGKTTLTERILFYTGRISSIHDVRGKDGVGAKMDSMDLEREKGITIQSAATFTTWKDSFVNIIDTPGHVDFTIEVERALRVLDGAILVLCSVSGVQSQSITVDRQMKRYNVPRLAFINKLDRTGANPWTVIEGLRNQLALNAAAVQIPIGLEEKHTGVVDLIEDKAYVFEGDRGEVVSELEVPDELRELFEEKRWLMLEKLADVDDDMAEYFLTEEFPPVDELKAAIRRQTLERRFVPVFMGSAFKNKGVQPLLDGVVDYLPNPAEVENTALDLAAEEAPVPVLCKPDEPLVALAFKLEESKFGQLTYLRLYQGSLKKGQMIVNLTAGQKKLKVPRLVRMHSDEMQEVPSASAGDVVAMFGVDCASMDTFTDGTTKLAMTSMFVPEPVMSLAVKPKDTGAGDKFAKALARFSKEDPTLRIHTDEENKETILSGMGELHLDIYVQRMEREYGLTCTVGAPRVNYRETVRSKAEFNYLHKKQSGGSGQYARVIGYIEPVDEDCTEPYEFLNHVVGTNIPPEYIPSCEKGVQDAVAKGYLTGHPMQGLRVVVTDGVTHPVDSSDMAFRAAMRDAIKSVTPAAKGCVLEPIMSLEVNAPAEFQGTIVSNLNRRMAVIQASETSDTGLDVIIKADVPLAAMFGYSTDLRSSTQGKGEFTMEFSGYEPVTKDKQEALVDEYRKALAEGTA